MSKFAVWVLIILLLAGGIFFVLNKKHLETISKPSFSNNPTSTPVVLNTPTSTPNIDKTTTTMIEEKLSLLTEDGVKIAGIYHKVKDSKIAVLLLHMMPATKESWNDFAKKLNEAGFSTLTIDLRGHGESTLQEINGKRKTLDYKYFSDPEHQESILDVEAASEFLEKEGFDLKHQYLVGASIGSNLAFEFASMHPEVKKIVLLSPGLDYHGLKAKDYLAKIQKDQLILAAVSKNDYYAYNSVKTLEKIAQGKGLNFQVVYYKDAGHGTNMFDKEKPDLADLILRFIEGKSLNLSG